MTALRKILSSSAPLIKRPYSILASSTLRRFWSLVSTGTGIVLKKSLPPCEGSTVRLPISVIPAARSTVETFIARSTASSGSVGASPPEKVPSAEATIKLVPNFSRVCLTSPFADSFNPTAATMPAAPSTGPSIINKVRTFLAVRPPRATLSISRNQFIATLTCRPYQLPKIYLREHRFVRYEGHQLRSFHLA